MSNKAFTLIELVIVIVILAILRGIQATPSIWCARTAQVHTLMIPDQALCLFTEEA